MCSLGNSATMGIGSDARASAVPTVSTGGLGGLVTGGASRGAMRTVLGGRQMTGGTMLGGAGVTNYKPPHITEKIQ